MSLNYDIRALPAYLKEGREWQETESLIFLTIAVGLNEITEKNRVEWIVRLRLMAGRIGGKDHATLLEAAASKRIGLRTNATRMTRAQFLKRLADVTEQDVRWENRNQPPATSTAA